PHHGQYTCFLGSVDSGWAYGAARGEIHWRTAQAPKAKATTIMFVGGSGYAPGKVDLWCNGEKLLSFDTAKTSDQQWQDNGATLRSFHGCDTRSDTTTFGISGIYVLGLPSAKVSAGRALDLAVKIPPGGSDWFMVHEYKNVRDATIEAICPEPEEPAIAAFTP